MSSYSQIECEGNLDFGERGRETLFVSFFGRRRYHHLLLLRLITNIHF